MSCVAPFYLPSFLFLIVRKDQEVLTQMFVSPCIRATKREGLLLPVCPISLSQPPAQQAPSASLLHGRIHNLDSASALCSVQMGNGMAAILSCRKDETINDGSHILGLFPCSKLYHNQKNKRTREFTRLCLSPNMPNQVRALQIHCLLESVLLLKPYHCFLLLSTPNFRKALRSIYHQEIQKCKFSYSLFISYFRTQKEVYQFEAY